MILAECLQLDIGAAADYVVDYRAAHLRRLEELRADGLIESHALYRHDAVLRESAAWPAWDFLSWTVLAPGVGADPIVAALASPARRVRTSAVTRRREVLRRTPASYHAGPSRAALARGLSPYVEIEYIDVGEGHLDEYRDSMRVNSGPAMALLMERGRAVDFLAAETVEVLVRGAGMPPWNQIHLSGRFAEDDATHLQSFDEALRTINPAGGYERVFGRLAAYRTHPRVVRASACLTL
ncbi:MAG TPA: hypothetical protein VED40_22620 [Azospirillaceae bacterium]|nr:hypothetical protein [Azospirillaceae bacterium]